MPHPDDLPTDEYRFWCPVCKEWPELRAATQPLSDAADVPATPANRCADCDSSLVLKKVEPKENSR